MRKLHYVVLLGVLGGFISGCSSKYRVHVNGFLDTRQALFTGMTRDGTFLVEDGREVGAVKNLRFTESMLAAFSRVAAVGRERRIIGTWSSSKISCTVPSLLIRDFMFTG